MGISVKRNEGYVDFCEDLSLQADWEAACDDLETIRKRPSTRMSDAGEGQAAAAVRDIEERMQASIVRIKIRALNRKRWQELGAEHPAREDNDQDRALGVNTSTFFDAVAKESIYAAVEKVSGDVRDFDPKTEWDTLADEMTNAQYGEFVQKFLALNQGGTKPGFSRAASLLTEDSEETSN